MDGISKKVRYIFTICFPILGLGRDSTKTQNSNRDGRDDRSGVIVQVRGHH